MAYFVKIGSFFGENLLLLAAWLLAANTIASVLAAEDENRIAHKKHRYSFLALAIISLVGGALGGLVGHMLYYSGRRSLARGSVHLILLICQLLLIFVSIIAVKESPVTYLSGAVADLRSIAALQSRLFSKYLRVIIILFASADVVSLVLFAVDKYRATRKKKISRIPERVLLAVSLCGGALGGTLGMLLFRHKIRHPKFSVTLPTLAALQTAFVLCVM